MAVPPFLFDRLGPERHVRAVSEGMWSALPDDASVERYDRRAAAYDAVVGSRLYNRLLWGSSPSAYASFAALAIRSGPGPMLDAGCGSLVFTARMYAEANRPIVLLDRSIGMLEAARDRLRASDGTLPAHIALLQADLLDLPFTSECFSTVLSMGMLHLFENVEGVASTLARTVTPGGRLFLSSLVSSTWIGRRYLSLLHRAGEVAAPRSQEQLVGALRRGVPGHLGRIESRLEGSMAFVELGGAA